MRLTNAPRLIARVCGFDSWQNCLPPKLGIDQYPAVLPLFAFDTEGRGSLFLKEIDRTNALPRIPEDVSPVFHSPYFSFDNLERPSAAFPDLPTAVRETLTDPVEIDDSLPVALYEQLHGAVRRLGPARASREQWPQNAYRIPLKTAEEACRVGRTDASNAVSRYAPHKARDERLRDWLNRDEWRPSFETLDELLSAADVDTLIAEAPLNIQELTGQPASAIPDGALAIYAKGSSEVWLLTRRELPGGALPEVRHPDVRFLDSLTRGTVGYEELVLPQRHFQALGLAEKPHVAASLILRRWRERRTADDIAYYLIGAQLTRRAIDAALALVSGRSKAGEAVCELDAYRVYRTVVSAELAENDLPLRVRTYFTHVHAGNRTHIPASATDHSLVPLTSLKIDAGLEIYDSRGYLRAASDITRTAVGTPEAEEFYATITQGLNEGVIAASQSGRTGEEVFLAGMNWLTKHRSDLEAGGFLPTTDLPLEHAFGRDIGHLLGKQEPATVALQLGNTAVLEPGMVAAAEIQWPYRQYCVGIEDVFVTTEGDPVNLTLPEL